MSNTPNEKSNPPSNLDFTKPKDINVVTGSPTRDELEECSKELQNLSVEEKRKRKNILTFAKFHQTGSDYERGNGVLQDFQKALYWYKRAVSGYGYAHFSIALLCVTQHLIKSYKMGVETIQHLHDYIERWEEIRETCSDADDSLGLGQAFHMLGYLYINEDASNGWIKNDIEKAIKNFEIASNTHKYNSSSGELANIYLHGIKGKLKNSIKANSKKAMNYALQGVILKDSLSSYVVAQIYYKRYLKFIDDLQNGLILNLNDEKKEQKKTHLLVLSRKYCKKTIEFGDVNDSDGNLKLLEEVEHLMKKDKIFDIEIIFICALCGKKEANNEKHKICSRCKNTRYCNLICQRKHWKHHKEKCKKMKKYFRILQGLISKNNEDRRNYLLWCKKTSEQFLVTEINIKLKKSDFKFLKDFCHKKKKEKNQQDDFNEILNHYKVNINNTPWELVLRCPLCSNPCEKSGIFSFQLFVFRMERLKVTTYPRLWHIDCIKKVAGYNSKRIVKATVGIGTLGSNLHSDSGGAVRTIWKFYEEILNREEGVKKKAKVELKKEEVQKKK